MTMADHAVYRGTIRRTWRSGALWGLVFGGLVAGSAAGYVSTFPDAASRAKLAQGFAGNLGISALVGPARELQTTAGYTEWRTVGLLGIVGAIWALLLATRVGRGEEEAGRWDLLLSGRTDARRATTQAAGALAVGWLVLFGVTALSAIAVGGGKDIGFSTSGSLLLAGATSASALVFLAIGALAGQLVPTRRAANLIAAAAFGVAYLVRLIADSSGGLAWLRWASPLGWNEEVRPLTDPRPLALLPSLALAVALAAVAVVLAGRRDVGGAVLPGRDVRAARLRLLDSPTTLAIRLSTAALVSWTIGMAVMGAVYGMVAQSAADSIQGSTVVEDMLRRLGGPGQGAAAYLGLTFLVSAAVIAFAAATQVASARNEEADGRVDTIAAAPIDRRRWLLGRVAVATALVVATSVVTGVAGWAGAASQDTPLDFGKLTLAGINLAPPALFVLGVGTLLLGVWPRAATTVVFAIVAWSFVVEFIGAIVQSQDWLLHTSLLFHIAPAPATDPRVGSSLVLVGLAAAGVAVGVAAFGRRDLQSA